MQIGSGISIGPGITVNGPVVSEGGGGGGGGSYTSSGLVLNLDAGDVASYPAISTVLWSDLSGNDFDATASFSMRGNWVDTGALTSNAQNYPASYFDLGYKNTNRWGEILNTVPASLRPTDAVTYEVIIIPYADSSKQTWLTVANGPKIGMSDGGATGASYFEMEVNGQTTANTVAAEFTEVYDQVFTHLLGTYDGSTIKVYVNGTQAATASYSGAITYDTEYPLWINGYRTDTPTSPPNKGKVLGGLALVRIYNRALNSTEVTNNYNWAKARPYGIP